jgi:hypothetical protein
VAFGDEGDRHEPALRIVLGLPLKVLVLAMAHPAVDRYTGSVHHLHRW